MRYRLIYKNTDVTNIDSVEGGTLHGLEQLKERVDAHLPDLLEKQGRARSIIRDIPGTRSLRMGTEWKLVDALDILFIPTETENGETPFIENYKLLGFVITPDYISFESTPWIPMTIQIIAETPMEEAIKHESETKNQLILELRDALRDDTEAKTFKVKVETGTDCVVIGFLNDQGAVVGEIEVENCKGKPKVYMWDSKDVFDEPTRTIAPEIDFAMNMSEQDMQIQTDIADSSDGTVNRMLHTGGGA